MDVYLSGEIHTDWRERIERGAPRPASTSRFTAPVTDHAASDDCGVGDPRRAGPSSSGTTTWAPASTRSAPTLIERGRRRRRPLRRAVQAVERRLRRRPGRGARQAADHAASRPSTTTRSRRSTAPRWPSPASPSRSSTILRYVLEGTLPTRLGSSDGRRASWTCARAAPASCATSRPRSASGRRSASARWSTARARCSCGSRGASCRPTPFPRRTSTAELRVGARAAARAATGRPAPGHPVRRAHGAGRPAAGRRLRGAPGSGSRDPDLPGYVVLDFAALRRLVRGGRARSTGTRATRSTASTSRTAPRGPSVELDGVAARRDHGARAAVRDPAADALLPAARGRRRGRARAERRALVLRRTRARRPTGRSPARRDIAWCYPRAAARGGRDQGLVAFWDERVDVFVDGERRGRPKTHWYD